MDARRLVWLILVSVASTGLLETAGRQAAGPSTGVVVETVAAGSSAQRAGLQAADAIVSWAEVDAGRTGPFHALGSAFEFNNLEIQHAPRRGLLLKGYRSGTSTEWQLEPGILGLTVRPAMPLEILDLHKRAESLVTAKQPNEAVERWRDGARRADAAGEAVLAAWLDSRAGGALTDARQWEAADAMFAEARARVEALKAPLILAEILRQQGRSYQIRLDWPQATAWYEKALEADRLVSAESLAVALDCALIGGIASRKGSLDEAETWYTRALKLREKLAPDSVAVADSFDNLSAVADQRGDLKAYEKYRRDSLAILERVAPGSVRLAAAIHSLGILSHNRGDLKAAEELYRKSLAIREVAAPDSIHVSLSLNSLGLAARERGAPDEAERLLTRALAIQEREAPDGLAVAQSLNNLGIVMRDRGDLARSEQYYRRSLDIRQRLSPDGVDVAASLNNLGLILKIRGDLEQAEELHLRALKIRERVAPGSLVVAVSFNNLGAIAYDRGDFATAADYYQQSLTIRERLAPKSLPTVSSLNNLAHSALDSGNFVTAQKYLRRGLQLLQEIAPNSPQRVRAQLLLALAAVKQEDLATAKAEAQLAVDLAERISPSSPEAADGLHYLADVMLQLNDIDGAQRNISRSLEILAAFGSPSMFEADGWHVQGQIHLRTGRTELAYDAFSKSVDVFERLANTSGGARDVRSAFRTKGVKFYGAAIETAIELKRPAEAFAFHERSRARSLLNMLVERDLLFTSEVPADLIREFRQTDVEYDNLTARLSSLGTDKKSEVERVVARLRELRNAREQLTRRLRQRSPHFADLQYPEPLNLEQVRNSLDAGTLLLSYWVGKDRSLLFAVQVGREGADQRGISVYPISIGEKELRTAVREFRLSLQPALRSGPQTRAVGGVTSRGGSTVALDRQATRLYELLLKPSELQIAASHRLVLVLDGPLHALPFAALRAPRSSARAARYLIEWKPLHVVASATVYNHTRKPRGATDTQPQPAGLIAFGDPELAASSAGTAAPSPSPILGDFARRGLRLTPLPAARREVKAIAGLFGARATVYLGRDATEERAKTIAQKTAYLHFASHALLDERLPLNSALVLAQPLKGSAPANNGLLQVWEIFEGLRIDAELVTLSACETALGEEFGGEGLIGLTRAFQFAGARSVVASLWSIADNSTEQLMVNFYRHLRAGRTKDEALRSAQLAAIRSQSTHSHPFHWAAFQVFGDWR